MNDIVLIEKPVTALELRRASVNNSAVLAALAPVERAVFLASTARTIDELAPGELAGELRKALQFVSRDTGYKGTTDDAYLIARLSEILKRHYSGLSMKDFRMAFEMSITGALDDYLPKRGDGTADRGHYQQFNAEYVCKILNAYRACRAGVLRKASEALPKPEEKPAPAVVARLMEREKEIFFEVLEAYRAEGKFPDGMTPITEIICCNVLAGAGLMQEIEVTETEQREIFQRTLNHYARTGNVGDLERLKKAGHEAPELQTKAYTIARRKALEAVFAKIVADGINITDYIKLD